MTYQTYQAAFDQQSGSHPPQTTQENSRYLIFMGHQVIVDEHDSPLLTYQQAQLLIKDQTCLPIESSNFMPSLAFMALKLKDEVEPPKGLHSLNLRTLIMGQIDETSALLSRAVQLLDFHKQHQFCGQCGKPTQLSDKGNSFKCSPCRLTLYPRIAPCVIVLVKKGNQCLLINANNRPTGFYSAIAGFIEPGETPEQAAKREVLEETGVHINNLRYLGSQSWPFPSQLMIGFIADYLQGEIQVDQSELQDAQWFSLQELPDHPPATTIAGRLILAASAEAQ